MTDTNDPSKPQSKWKSASTTKPPRMVDRELQRIKSLAMVSGLNRAFSQEPQSISPLPSISTTPAPGNGTSSPHHHQPHHYHRPATVCDMRSFGTRSQRSSSISSLQSRRSMSRLKASASASVSASASASYAPMHRLKAAELDELERELLGMFEQAYLQRSQEQRVDNWVVSVMPPPPLTLEAGSEDASLDDPTLHENKRYSCALSSQRRDSISSERSCNNNNKDQRIRELETLYAATLKKLSQSEQQHARWEQHVQQTVAACVEDKEAEAGRARQLAEVVLRQEMLMEQMEQRLHQASTAANTTTQSSADGNNDEEEHRQARQTLKQLKTEIAALSDTRTDIQSELAVLRRELEAGQQLLQTTWETSQALAAECSEQRTQMVEKLDALKRQVMDKDMLLHKMYRAHKDLAPERPARNSNRDSKHRSAATAAPPRWTGGPLPPPAPPPTEPLPPVPVSPPPAQPHPSDDTASSYSKRPSVSSSAGGASSCFEDPETEAAYREFAEQLQTRLSVSKEIDDLRVWEPADLDEFQKRMSRWSDMHDDEDLKRHSIASSLRSKEGAAFWRGMKKKLRV